MTLRSVQGFHTPESKEAVAELLQQYGDGALIVAGGSFVHGLIARGLLTELDAIIDMRRVPLNYVRADGGGLRIGATTTFAELKAAPEVQSSAALGCLTDTLHHPPVQVLNAATVGGCVASSCPFFDVPTALVALNSTLTVLGANGERSVPLDEFFTGLFDNALAEGEFVTELQIPDLGSDSASAALKLEANANDLAIINVASWIRADKKGNCSDARIYVGGGVGETVVRATSAEQAVIGQRLDDELFSRAAAAGRGDVSPISDHRASAEYRSAIVGVYIQRTLQQAAARLA